MDGVGRRRSPNEQRSRIVKFGPLHVLVRETEDGLRVERVSRSIEHGDWNYTTEEIPLDDAFRARRFRAVGAIRIALRDELAKRGAPEPGGPAKDPPVSD